MVLCSVFLIEAVHDVRLRIIDEKGKNIQTVLIGEPFFIELSLGSAPQRVQSAQGVIDGLDSVEVFDTKLNILNDQVSYFFGARVMRPVDTISLGPVTIGGTKYPATITARVAPPPAFNQSKHMTMRFSPHEGRIFVGQKVPIELVIEKKEKLELRAIDFPDSTDDYSIIFDEAKKPNPEEMLITYRATFIPKRAGKLVVPGCMARYSLKYVRNGMDIFAEHLAFFGLGSSPLSLRSNALLLDISDLPKGVQAIGSFTHFSLSLNKSECTLDSALSATLTLEGDGSLDLINVNLQVPEGLSAFRAGSRIEGSKKIFEYVIQAEHEGTYEIPVQHFSYIDPASGMVRHLKTSPAKIKMLPGAATSVSARLQEEIQEQGDMPSITEKWQMPLLQKGTNKGFSWGLWFLLLGLVPLIMIVRFIPLIYSLLGRPKSGARIMREGLRNMRRCLRKNSYDQLNQIINRTVGSFFEQSDARTRAHHAGYFSQSEIISILENNGYSAEIVQKYLEISNQVLSLGRFAPHDMALFERDALKRTLYERIVSFFKLLQKQKKASVLPIIVFCFFVSQISSTPELQRNSLAKAIALQRNEQRDAYGWEYLKAHQNIENIRKHGNGTPCELSASDYVSLVLRYVPLWLLQVLALLVWILFFIFLGLGYIRWAFVFICIGGLLISANIWIYIQTRADRAVMVYATDVFSGPGTSFTVKGAMNHLEDVTILKRHGSWYHISSASIRGWVPETTLEKV